MSKKILQFSLAAVLFSTVAFADPIDQEPKNEQISACASCPCRNKGKGKDKAETKEKERNEKKCA